MPESGVPLTPSSELLQGVEIERLLKFFVEQCGVTKLRFTGGEPTLRKDLKDIIGSVGHFPTLTSVGITSNGMLLNSRNLEELAKNGLTHLNVSLDTLQEPKFQFITRRKGFRKVLQTIDLARRLVPIVKVNCVVMRGLNDDELLDFVDLTKDKNIDVRFIEYMPFSGNKWSLKKLVPYAEMLAFLKENFGQRLQKLPDEISSTSKGYKIDGYTGQFGFISSMTKHFCGSCNRLRITADGNLKVCLHGNAEVSLKNLLRANATESELYETILGALQRKKFKHAGMTTLAESPNRPMVLIGG